MYFCILIAKNFDTLLMHAYENLQLEINLTNNISKNASPAIIPAKKYGSYLFFMQLFR